MPEKELTLVGHLAELRKRLIYCLIPFLLTVVFSVPFAKSLLFFLRIPAQGVIEKLAFFSPQEVVLVYFKISLFSGLILSLPVILYQIWGFILPALAEKQKRFALSFISLALLAFLLGCAFGYLFLTPISLKFLLAIAGDELTPVISLSKYLSFVLALVLGCGLVFETPVLIWILTRLKIATPEFLRKKRKYAYALLLIAAAIVTPTTDPFNMCLLALPMILLYEIGIWVSRWN
ncbi:MAG: twin arginine-targeting protein translocase TatC [Omnitrophica WOR_2 bacterium RIFCSPHIGHO2_02_FULL_45_21]|nr:MAG: twin arginine-targeting protein translocase TatC [Omnitrophica WOR_2 bacterium RIFCSPHIGHO2_02_FULL_45_21]